MSEKAVARDSDLKAHIKADPKTVHGIWEMIAAATAVQSKARFRAYVTAAQNNLVANTWTKVVLDTETYDLGGNFDSTTNYRFTAPVAGFYHFDAMVQYSDQAASNTYEVALYVDGAAVAIAKYSTNAESDACATPISDTLRLAANSYVEVWAKVNTVSTSDIQVGTDYTFFSGHILSRDI